MAPNRTWPTTGRWNGLAVLALAAAASASASTPVLSRLVIGQVPPTPAEPALPSIGQADLERAGVLLEQARQQLHPQQYELLERELAQAKGAWQRFTTLARANGQAAEVARGAQAPSAAQRMSRLSKGVGTFTRTGPLLVALALLWPASTAGPNEDPPPWLRARLELEAKLQNVAKASTQVGEQIASALPKGTPEEDLPGDGPGWTKLRGNQGWRDRDGNLWKKDQLHKDHWDVSNPKGEKIREVDFEGNQIWPDGPKNKNKRP